MKYQVHPAIISGFIFLALFISGLVALLIFKKEYNDVETQEVHYSLLHPCQPQLVHISFSDTVQDINVVWATIEFCQTCQVRYGTDPWNLHLTSPSFYNNFVQMNTEGLHHHYRAKLEGLSPNTTYYYLPSCEGLSTGPHFFKVPRIDMDWVPTFLVFGDLGVKSEFFSPLMSEALTGQYTAILHVGDFAYDFHYDGGRKGDKFMELIEPAAAYTPYMTCPGNHEIEEGTFAHYRNRFAMPESDWPIPVDKMWYSFDIGHVHFVSYSTEVFFANDGTHAKLQRDWLLKDLDKANKNRQKTPWVITFGHRPLYCSTHIGDDCSKNTSLVRKNLEDIFYNFSVDIVLQAHEHNYERLWPVYKGNVTDFSYVNAVAPIQLITGAPGSREGADLFPNKTDSQPVWSAFRMDNAAMNSYGRLLIINTTHIWWEQRKADDHKTIDSIWIIKDETQQNITSKLGPSAGKKITLPINNNLLRKEIFRKYSHALAVGIAGGCLLVVIIAVIVTRIALKMKRRKEFSNTWQSSINSLDDQDEMEDNGPSSSLL